MPICQKLTTLKQGVLDTDSTQKYGRWQTGKDEI